LEAPSKIFYAISACIYQNVQQEEQSDHSNHNENGTIDAEY